MEMFQRTLISCVNTRLAFDSKILFPKDQDGKRKEKRLAFDSKILFPKDQDSKQKEKPQLIYKFRNLETNVYEDKRFIPKILKMDENN